MAASTESEAAGILRGIADLVYRGELEADTPRARVLLRHLEGAAVALEAAGDSKRARRRSSRARDQRSDRQPPSGKA